MLARGNKNAIWVNTCFDLKANRIQYESWLLWPGCVRRADSFLTLPPSRPVHCPRRRSAFATTLTDERLIARAAIIGDSRTPNSGYSAPAAIGIPMEL